MIINIRGTSGSGKSTLVKSIMALYITKAACAKDGRKRPYYYTLAHADPNISNLLVPGHYETACGGCDTVKTVDEVYELVNRAGPNFNVLYEGIMVMDDVRRVVELNRRLPGQLVVVGLTTPVDVCLASVGARRETRGDTRPLDPKNTVNRAKSCARGLERLVAGGVRVERWSREEAFVGVAGLLGLGSV